MDPTVVQPAVGTRGPYGTAPSARMTTNDRVVGDIPALRPGFQPRPALMAQLTLASQSPPVQGNARSCVSCHSQIHGSNHPAGAKFQR